MKSGRSLNGTAQTLSNAFWAACVTPKPPHSEASRPMISAVTLPGQRMRPELEAWEMAEHRV